MLAQECLTLDLVKPLLGLLAVDTAVFTFHCTWGPADRSTDEEVNCPSIPTEPSSLNDLQTQGGGGAPGL